MRKIEPKIEEKLDRNIFSKETIKAIEDAKRGRNLSKDFDNVDKMFEELDK